MSKNKNNQNKQNIQTPQPMKVDEASVSSSEQKVESMNTEGQVEVPIVEVPFEENTVSVPTSEQVVDEVQNSNSEPVHGDENKDVVDEGSIHEEVEEEATSITDDENEMDIIDESINDLYPLYVIFIGIMTSEEKIEKVKARLDKAGLEISSGDENDYYVGPFSSKEEAIETRKKMYRVGVKGSIQLIEK